MVKDEAAAFVDFEEANDIGEHILVAGAAGAEEGVAIGDGGFDGLFENRLEFLPAFGVLYSHAAGRTPMQ